MSFTITSSLVWSFAKHSFRFPLCLETSHLGLAKFKIMPKKLLRDFEPMTLQILIFFGPMLDDTCMSDFRNLISPRMPQNLDRKEGALNTWDCPTDNCYLITHKGQFAFGENVASLRRYRVPGYKPASSSMWSPWV